MKAFLVIASAVAALASPTLDQVFQSWMSEYNRTYTGEEYTRRRTIFHATFDEVYRLNMAHRGMPSAARFDLNHLADRSRAERRELLGLLGVAVSRSDDHPRSSAPRSGALPTSVDWRSVDGVVAPVIDQGRCGSSWATGAATNVESRLAIAEKRPVNPLSVQQLIDCDKVCGTYGSYSGCDSGCGGGLMPNAYIYYSAYQMKSESEYPYTGIQGECLTFDRANGTISPNVWVYKDSVEEVMSAVAMYPVAIGVYAETWAMYKGGILRCSPRHHNDLEHGAAVVGYGTSADGVDYWIVRNSWGVEWGENGYIRVERGPASCGVEVFASSAALASDKVQPPARF